MRPERQKRKIAKKAKRKEGKIQLTFRLKRRGKGISFLSLTQPCLASKTKTRERGGRKRTSLLFHFPALKGRTFPRADSAQSETQGGINAFLTNKPRDTENVAFDYVSSPDGYVGFSAWKEIRAFTLSRNKSTRHRLSG